MTHKTKRVLLVIDDDQIFTHAVKEFFRRDNFEVLTANSGQDGILECSRRKVDLVLLDQNLPDTSGHGCCPQILRHNEQTKIIFATAFPSYKSAVEAIKAGACDYLSKPFELEELRLTVERWLRTLDLEDVEQFQNFKKDKEIGSLALVGAENGLSEVLKMIDLASSEDAPVLITGETGTGKNVVAKYIHYRGSKKSGPFIFVNCAALPESLIEAELFGFEKGAFTNAVAAKKGVFEIADGGTLLLDEIGAMPVHLQSKLLGVLEDQKVRRLGGETIRDVNVRFIAATNTDLEAAVQQKTFRDDLYYRLSVIRIHMPPLRDRPNDIPGLCRHFLENIPTGKNVVISETELERLKEYGWPGNVRELKNIIERACILQRQGEITPSRLLVRPGVSGASAEPDGKTFSLKADVPPSLYEMEDKYIKFVFDMFSGNYTRTALALGISRSTLKRKLKSCLSGDSPQ